MIVLKDKKISIIGAGRTGISSAEAIKRFGGIPFISDSGMAADSDAAHTLESMGIPYEFDEHSQKIYDCDFMLISPGVPSDAEIIREAKSREVTVWPEIELAFRICRGKIIGVTGSNGKTTVTTLIGEILKQAGYKAAVCGNIGHPFVKAAPDIPPDGFAVVELSSFQLEMIEDFRPHVAVFLNITPDHLDRHGTLENYITAKMRIFENQTSDDFAVANFDDPTLRERCSSLDARTVWFSIDGRIPDGVRAEPEGDIAFGEKKIMKSNGMKIKGVHNLSNACAAAAAALTIGIDIPYIADVLSSFPGVEHRLEPVRLIGGVSFINDSKGTNVDSVRWALLAVPSPIILIAGGKDKDGDFTALNDLIAQKVKKVFLIGQAAKKIRDTWNNLTHCEFADNMPAAVRAAFATATRGDTVLLSPGCASFDMFDNFEHRGKVFKETVSALTAREVSQ